MLDFESARDRMVRHQIEGRGVRDPRVLAAMREVPREAFVPPGLQEFAYEDSPLPIEAGQTISQPFIVAEMIESLELRGGERVLDIGTGSGYAAAVLARIAGEVYSVERHAELVELARARFAELGIHNVHVLHGDGTLGWPEHAPYDAVVAAAGGPDVPSALRDQLKVGGRLVIPIGPTPREQKLIRETKVAPRKMSRTDLGGVRFVPLVGAAGWPDTAAEAAPAARPKSKAATIVELLRETIEPFPDIATADTGALLERIGNARVVLLGEATHGTSEFYRMRAHITQALIERKGFRIVAVEADWPDAATIDRYVRGISDGAGDQPSFARFPTWMWRNLEVQEFVDWLRVFNEVRDPGDRAAFYGLDLYSLYRSIHEVLAFLDRVDPEAARIARHRYGCLSPWEQEPAVYGKAVITGQYRGCEQEVVGILKKILEQRLEYSDRDGARFLDAAQNARIVANAERYYRMMYYGSVESWNLRDGHMFDTLTTLLNAHGPEAKAVVWEHNSHVGNAAATEMGTRGEHNVGQLSRERFGSDAFLVGFGTDRGTVAAAHDWGGAMEAMRVRPAHPESYERLFHETGVEAGILHLREPVRSEVRGELEAPRLERAIGVIYRPDSELQSHYFQALLPHQFDEYIWFDETEAVTPLAAPHLAGVPETYPFGV
jgi:protein-L-isoaspartate(D-aspartate) O-methyltransferase